MPQAESRLVVGRVVIGTCCILSIYRPIYFMCIYVDARQTLAAPPCLSQSV